MRILHLNDRLSNRGGADIHLLSIINHLSPEHDVLLGIGCDDGTATCPCEITCVSGLDARESIHTAINRVFEQFRPDVVHLHNIMNPSVLHWGAEHGAVITVQDHRSFCPGRGKWTTAGVECMKVMNRQYCAQCFTDIDYLGSICNLTRDRLNAIRGLQIIVLSNYMRGELVAAGVTAGQIHVIPPFVDDLGCSNVTKLPRCILFAGRLVKAKGVYDAVDIWKQSGLHIPLVFAGTGSERQELEGLGFEVTGWLSRERLVSYYNCAEALLMPPRWQEPFGIVGLEALSMGIPVVAWESGGIRDWHPGPLAKWGDIETMASMLDDSVGKRVDAPTDFDREALMETLVRVYQV